MLGHHFYIVWVAVSDADHGVTAVEVEILLSIVVPDVTTLTFNNVYVEYLVENLLCKFHKWKRFDCVNISKKSEIARINRKNLKSLLTKNNILDILIFGRQSSTKTYG